MIDSKAVLIPFRPEFKEALLEGRKTMTARTKKYGDRGDQFEAFGVPFVILKVEKIRLSDVASKFFAEEGVESPEAYEKKWAEIHPNKGFVLDQEVFLHTFIRRKFLLENNYWPGNNAYIERVLAERNLAKP
jgi:hypothetical protein